MSTWKSKFFGDNRTNFYGWIFTGLLILAASGWLVIRAIDLGAYDSPICVLLMAIYILLVGCLCVALQNYCARVAKNIEAEDAKKTIKKDDTTAA